MVFYLSTLSIYEKWVFLSSFSKCFVVKVKRRLQMFCVTKVKRQLQNTFISEGDEIKEDVVPTEIGELRLRTSERLRDQHHAVAVATLAQRFRIKNILLLSLRFHRKALLP